MERKYFNVKTGAIVGGLSSLLLSTLIVTTNPQLKELPIEEKIQGVLFATGLLTISYAIGFDMFSRITNNVGKYFESNKINDYLLRR